MMADVKREKRRSKMICDIVIDKKLEMRRRRRTAGLGIDIT